MKDKTYSQIRKAVFNRDKYRCQICKRSNSQVDLTIHHIIPRPIGEDEMDNMITLCKICHDEVELQADKLDTKDKIKSFVPNWMYELNRFETLEYKSGLPESYDWHTWVYGGAVNPHKTMSIKEIHEKYTT